MRLESADRVRALIAQLVLGPPGENEVGSVGSVTLHPHQREGLERVRRVITAHRGALLADDVGLGKTYVALALARDARAPLVLAPAALRDAWHASAERAGVRLAFASLQSLSRAAPSGGPFDLVIVDEAHHLRSRDTKRFAAAVETCRDARVLLMTATPVQNRLADLRNILSLFLGERALHLPAGSLSACMIRRTERDLDVESRPLLPRSAPPIALARIQDVDGLDRIMALPPPVPPAGGGDGGVLLAYTLVRQWGSSRAALRGALRRRIARARAIEDALLAGCLPTASELAAWSFADTDQQLIFPELVVSSSAVDPTSLLESVRRHAEAIRDLAQSLDAASDPDVDRANALRDVLRRHPGERVIAFSEYAETVVALYRLLSRDQRVAMLTHGGARVAGGRMTRRELLSRFGPLAARVQHERDRIDLLITTDVLSEGVDLQAASVVIHLDLAWNPARLQQRVGRLRRLGAAFDRVAVYVMPPPAPAERLLQLERRLRVKLGVAAATVGVAGAILPGIDVSDSGDAGREERVAALLRRWRSDAMPPVAADAGPLVAGVRASIDGMLACCRRGGEVVLVSGRGGQIDDARDAVEACLDAASGPDAPTTDVVARSALDDLTTWLERRDVTDVVSLPELRMARARRALLHRVDRIARRVPRHAQPGLAPLIRAARAVAGATLSAGAERVLDELTSATLDDDAWLHAMREFAALHATAAGRPCVLALILLVADGD